MSSMTIREKVARAIRQKTAEIDHRPDVVQPDPMWFAHEFATAAITAFLEAAAEQGWHMKPRAATDDMMRALYGPYLSETAEETRRASYRAMLAAAPEFEWDK